MGNRIYALVGRCGDDGGRYLQWHWDRMKVRGWEMYCAGNMVQVWRANNAGLVSYDSAATQRMTDYIVKEKA